MHTPNRRRKSEVAEGIRIPGQNPSAMKYLLYILYAILIMSCNRTHKDFHTQFENLWDGHLQQEEPGGAILVQKGEEIVFLKSYGIADLDSREKITPQTIFNTGSISKTFVSYGILMLEQAGRLSLEDHLAQYFSDFDHPAISEEVRILHLMTHTSGLPDSRKVSEEFEFYLTARDAENFEPIKHTEALHFTPGEQFEYSNPAFNGLALIIESVTGNKWQSYIRENVFGPSGMIHSKITDGPYPETGVAHGYVPGEDGYIELDYGEEPTFAAAGNGGVWCSIEDLARYEAAIRDFVFLPKTVIQQSRDVQTMPNWTHDKRPEVGLSWFIAEKDHPGNAFGVKIISHTGWQGGFRGFMISIPEKDILYAGLFNRPLNSMSESYNPFTATRENVNDVRVEGIRILQENNWLDISGGL